MTSIIVPLSAFNAFVHIQPISAKSPRETDSNLWEEDIPDVLQEYENMSKARDDLKLAGFGDATMFRQGGLPSKYIPSAYGLSSIKMNFRLRFFKGTFAFLN